MNLNEMTKDEAIKQIRVIIDKFNANKDLTKFEDYFLGQIQYHVEQKVIGDIRKRQAKIPGLKISGNNRKSFWGGELTPGCENCLDGSGLGPIRSVSKCNLNCNFCYYLNNIDPILLPDHFKIGNKYYTSDDIKMILDKQGDELGGIAWVFYEPFMDFDKHPKLIEYISKKGIHQHMYTNGTLCTEDQFKVLRDCGLREIRFNLAATNCSKNVLKNMKIARNYFKYLCIESPMYKGSYESFMKNKNEIIETGVDHINCAELHLKSIHTEYLKEPLYRYKYGYMSPISSRHLTYNLIEIAINEKWEGITIHDCSNETKFYRSFKKKWDFGVTTWNGEARLPNSWYEEVLTKYDIFNNILKKIRHIVIG